jgi:anion-transporting  ArsA/GET3 family ATPase
MKFQIHWNKNGGKHMEIDYSNMTDEEIGKAIRLEEEMQNHKRKIWNLRTDLFNPMSNANKILNDSYRGKEARIRFADMSPQQMLLDLYTVEESLKAARQKICEYIDEIKVYEDTFQQVYRGY